MSIATAEAMNSGEGSASDPGVLPPRECWWPPVVVLVLYWSLIQASVRLEIIDVARFGLRVLPNLIGLIFFSIWWFRRPILWRQRWLTYCAVLALFALTCLVADKSFNAISLVFAGFGWLWTLGVAWWFLSRAATSARRAAGVVAVAGAVFGVLLLFRWEGLDGRQQATYRWRWSPTAEEQFLATQTAAAGGSSTRTAAPRTIALQPGDWSGFRGGDREGVVRGANLAHWASEPPREVWRRKLGPGWSSLTVVDGLVFTQEQRGAEECAVCYDAATGDEVWVYSHPARFDEALSGAGPRGTPTFADGRVYVLGARGELACLAADTGETAWSQDTVAKFQATVPQWGVSVSPLVTDGMAIVHLGGGNGHGVVALDAVSGEMRWKAAAGTQTYASPHVVTLNGVRQLVCQDEQGLRGLDVITGQQLWVFQPTGTAYQPMLQPHSIDEDELLVAWEGLVRLKFATAEPEWTVTEVWSSRRLRPSFNDFYIHEGDIYGLDSGILCCLSLEDGERKWKRGRYGSGQLLLLPDADQLLVVTEEGGLALVAADPAEFRELAQAPALTGKTWNHATLVRGQLFVRNAEEMACFRCESEPAETP